MVRMSVLFVLVERDCGNCSLGHDCVDGSICFGFFWEFCLKGFHG